MAATTEIAAKTYDAVQNPKPEAIVVYCSDPRFQKAFGEFIAGALKLEAGQFVPLVVGGGAHVLEHPERLPKEFKFMKERFELYTGLFSTIRRVILISHEDCKYTQSLKERVVGFLGAHPLLADHARGDLTAVGQVFGRLLSHLGAPVELYYAKFADPEHSKISFEQIKV